MELVTAIQNAVNAAKAKGLKVLVGTLLPFKGAGYYTDGSPSQIPGGGTVPYNGEKVREDVNAFIRSNTTIDGVVDFEAAVRSSSDPNAWNLPLNSGDFVHPNDIGYGAMAKAVDLTKLR